MLNKLSENILDKFSMDFLRNQVLKNVYGTTIPHRRTGPPGSAGVVPVFGLVPWFVNDLPCFCWAALCW